MYDEKSTIQAHCFSGTRADMRLIGWGHELPSVISVELTSKCNLKCKMCPLTLGTSSSSRSVSFIDLSVWRDLLQEIEGHVEKVILTGFGEPMLHPHLIDILSDLEERCIPFGLTTNGVHITPGIEESLPKLLYLRHLNVSIDSFDPEIYKRIRKGNVAKCLGSIDRLRRACGPHTVFSVSALIMKTTLPSLLVAPRQLAELGVRDLVLQSLFDQDPLGLDEHISNPKEAAAEISAIRRAAEENGVTLHFESAERLEFELNDPVEAKRRYFDDSRDHGTTRLCGLPWDILHVDANNQIFPCCRTAAVDECSKGHLQGRSLSDIWRGREYETFRQSFGDPDTLPEACATCTAVPKGIPPQVEYCGRILDDLEVCDSETVRVRVRNTGTAVWNSDHSPVIGVSRPRDRPSPLKTDRWISANRVCAMREAQVEPGGVAHFDMPLSMSAHETTAEHFELVIDGKLWMPGTGFSIES